MSKRDGGINTKYGVLLFYLKQINAWLSDWETLCVLEKKQRKKF